MAFRAQLFIGLLLVAGCGEGTTNESLAHSDEMFDEGDYEWRPVSEPGVSDSYPPENTPSDADQQRFLAQRMVTEYTSSEVESAFPNLDQLQFYESLKARIKDPSLFEQGNLLTCGAACLCYVMATEEPQRFALFALNLFHYGRDDHFLGGKEIIVPEEMLNRKPGDSEWPTDKTINDPVDWLLMCALTSSNLDDGCYADPGDSGWDGITNPNLLAEWLSGFYENVENDASLIRPENVDYMEKVDERFNKGYQIPLLLNAALIDPDRFTLLHTFPDHWVMYRGNLEITNDRVRFDVWTWGRTETIDVPINAFNKLFYGALFAKEKRIIN